MTESPKLHFELAKALDMRPLTIGDGRCAWGMEIKPPHMNPYGVVHGGLLYTLVDYATGGALTSTLEGGQRCTTLEIKMSYVAPATAGIAVNPIDDLLFEVTTPMGFTVRCTRAYWRFIINHVSDRRDQGWGDRMEKIKVVHDIADRP
jgi:uncharacterized protein (TIGR00369 family)